MYEELILMYFMHWYYELFNLKTSVDETLKKDESDDIKQMYLYFEHIYYFKF